MLSFLMFVGPLFLTVVGTHVVVAILIMAFSRLKATVRHVSEGRVSSLRLLRPSAQRIISALNHCLNLLPQNILLTPFHFAFDGSQEVSLAYETKILLGWAWQSIARGAPSNSRAHKLIEELTALDMLGPGKQQRSPGGAMKVGGCPGTHTTHRPLLGLPQKTKLSFGQWGKSPSVTVLYPCHLHPSHADIPSLQLRCHALPLGCQLSG